MNSQLKKTLLESPEVLKLKQDFNLIPKDHIDFLKKSQVTEIFTSVMIEDDGSYSILGSEMNINQKNAQKLSRLIDKHDGSWRADMGTARGWSSFETE